MRKPRLSRITGKPIKKFSINLKIGKRTFKNATPFAAYSYLKNNPKNVDNGLLLDQFNNFRNEYKKWKSKKLRNYSKPWRTRIKRKLEELEYFAYDFFRSESASIASPNSTHFHLMGNAYFNQLDSRWEHLWPWIVRNDFGGDEREAMEQYEKWVLERWN